jgi:peptide chain release factor subunit 1
MSKKITEFIRKLSEVYDPNSMDTYVSLYIQKNSNKKLINRRIRVCKSILKGEELNFFLESIKDIMKILNKNKDVNIAIFASHKYDFLEYITLSMEIRDLLVVDSSPYLRPLARLKDEWESFTLLLINSNYAKIFSVSTGEVKNSKKFSADIINKHKKGGWSQARFNRLRRGAINEFFSEVQKAFKKLADERIIIAGPGQAKLQFLDMLPKNLKENIVEIVDININREAEILYKSKHLITEREEIKSHEIVEQLKSEILKDGLAVYGLKETLNAAKNGQIELLIIEKEYKPRGWICENCQIVDKGFLKNCPYCGRKTSEVDVIEEILEFAERTDADIEFTANEEIANLGHVGAILRFK